jgi:type II secretory pathway pseudopilin PulG
MKRSTLHFGPPIAHGFVMVEMLVVIGLLAVVGLVAGQLFRVTMQVQRESAWQQIHESQLDQAVRQLRTDVWRASSIDVRRPDAVRLNMSDGQEIDWEAGSSLVRKSLSLAEDQPEQRWNDLGVSLRFTQRGVGLVVDVSRGAESQGRTTLISQEMLLSGRSR